MVRPTESHTPVAVSGLSNVVAIAAGYCHTCALRGDGTARCWGNNDYGQLGDNSTDDRLTPVAVSGLSNAVAIAAGWRPHLRPARRRHRPLLGPQQRGRAGKRHDGGPPYPGGR